MSKTRLLSMALVGLLLLNIGIISVVMLRQDDSLTRRVEDQREPKWIVIERLHFDAKQQEAYQALIDVHKVKHHQLNDECRALKQNLYTLLRKQPVDTVLADSLIAQVALKQQRLEQLNFRHFQDVRAICRPEQIADFDLLVTDLVDIFAHRGPRTNDNKR